jgi:hypothetical protein
MMNFALVSNNWKAWRENDKIDDKMINYDILEYDMRKKIHSYHSRLINTGGNPHFGFRSISAMLIFPIPKVAQISILKQQSGLEKKATKKN